MNFNMKHCTNIWILLKLKKKWISILEMKNKFRMNIILYGHELCIFLALSLSTTVVVNYGTNKYMLGI